MGAVIVSRRFCIMARVGIAGIAPSTSVANDAAADAHSIDSWMPFPSPYLHLFFWIPGGGGSGGDWGAMGGLGGQLEGSWGDSRGAVGGQLKGQSVGN